MNLPLQISSDFLRSLAPNDSRIVRVILRHVKNGSSYRLRGKKRTYYFKKCPQTCAHVLDVPESIWNDGLPAGKYRDNLSIAHDLFGNLRPGNSPLVPILVKVGEETPAEVPPDHIPVIGHLRNLLSSLGAPDEVREAFDMIDRGESHLLGDFVAAIVGAPCKPDCPAPTSEDNAAANDAKAERARKMREAKARKKAEAAAASPPEDDII